MKLKKCFRKLKIGKNSRTDLISNEIIKCSSIITIKSITKLLNSFLISLQNCIAKLLIVGVTPLAGENHILH